MKFTLDMTAIIDIEKKRKPYAALKELVKLHGKGDIEVWISEASASERQQVSKSPAEFISNNYEDFDALLKSIGIDHLPRYTPLLVLGESYIGKAKLATNEMIKFAGLITNTIFKKEWGDLDPKNGKDWSRRRDAMTFLSHVDNDGGTFITSDSHFLKKVDVLKKIAKEYNGTDIDIMKPEDALRKAKEFIRARKPDTTYPEQ